MKILLYTIGKNDFEWLNTAIEIYFKRLNFYVDFKIKYLPDIKSAKALSISQIKEKEGDMLLPLINKSDELILMDEHGKTFSSVEFSDFLNKKMINSVKSLVFVIGGAYGFSESVYARANAKISLSRMTFSHQMVRLIFVEQLYRAFTIIRGEPYHHE